MIRKTAVMPPEAWPDEFLQSPHDVPGKAGRVRRMFDAIAPRYELINTIFSAGRDAAWRRKAVSLAQVRGDDDVLDIACGTGDFARAFRECNPRSVVGCDFAHQMLIRAVERSMRNMQWCESDALQLPFPGCSFSICSCAFGVRNFQDLGAGLAEMHRVLRGGGRAVILEFTVPKNPLLRGLYQFYSGRFMPWAATRLSGDVCGAYRYLPRSVVSFSSAAELCAAIRRAGFSGVTTKPLTFGIATVYVAQRD